jgi:hypothetical protein
MSSIEKAFDKAFNTMRQRGWDKIYVFLDIHETMLYPDYNNQDPLKFYEHAEEVLQYLSTRKDISLGLLTCSYPDEIKRYLKFFSEHNINFVHVNKNLEVKNTRYGYYEDKPYFNVFFEDKAGFDAHNDWILLKQYFGLTQSELKAA